MEGFGYSLPGIFTPKTSDGFDGARTPSVAPKNVNVIGTSPVFAIVARRRPPNGSYLSEKYQYRDKINHEPVKAIQKERDGMARLLDSLVGEENTIAEDGVYIEIHKDEVENFRKLEREVISQLPEREHNK
ncbi:hypothetical protein OB920_05250 [Halobacteria archaeon HArc-gm2]|nr:hypothetical protein [Halobacteria archaeon HArc-gm2]